MHPLNPKNFGVDGMAVTYYNGSSAVNGYITKQVSANKFNITDGTNPKQQLILAPTTAIASAINSGNAAYFTIPVFPPSSGATGGTFTAHYAVDSATVVSSPNNIFVGDQFALPSGSGSLTVATLSGSAIATVSVGTAGSYTSLFSDPVTCTRAAGSGATFTAHYAVDSAVLANGTTGTGYAVSDVLTLTGTGSATLIVDTVDGSGHILTFHIGAIGTVTALPSNPVAHTGGTGTLATFTLKWKVLSVGSSGGTGYNVGDTLIFNGMTSTTAPTAHISVATSHAATTVVVDTSGHGITVAASSITTSTTTATFHVLYNLATVTSSGGSGYAVNDQLLFTGLVATVHPAAHISTASSGAATATTVDTHGSGISVAATSIGVGGPTEHVLKVFESKLLTTEGNSYLWSVGAPSPVENGAYIAKYSDLV